MKNRFITSLFTLGFFLFNITMAFAEEEFEDDVEDIPTVPINDYIWLAVLLGIVAAFFWMKKKNVIRQF